MRGGSGGQTTGPQTTTVTPREPVSEDQGGKESDPVTGLLISFCLCSSLFCVL